MFFRRAGGVAISDKKNREGAARRVPVYITRFQASVTLA